MKNFILKMLFLTSVASVGAQSYCMDDNPRSGEKYIELCFNNGDWMDDRSGSIDRGDPTWIFFRYINTKDLKPGENRGNIFPTDRRLCSLYQAKKRGIISGSSCHPENMNKNRCSCSSETKGIVFGAVGATCIFYLVSSFL